MSLKNMVRRQLYLPQNLNRRLKDWAKANEVTESQVVREALAQYLEQEKRRTTSPENNPVFKMKGIFVGDESCVSAGEKHDQIVYRNDGKP